MPHIAFLSTDNLEAFFVYDELLIPHFEAKGWQVSTVSWRNKSVDWNVFDYVVVRSTWDYQQHADAFLQCLKEIDQSSASLLNPLTLIMWNIEKHYLRDLESSLVPIVRTQWYNAFNLDELNSAFDELNSDTLVLKPVLSANADDTFKLTRESLAAQSAELSHVFQSRDFMVQPFLESVINEGEYSLFYFGGTYSHAIKKVPKKGDFRVQEEHGGSLHAVDADNEQMSLAQRALKAMPENALYARVDLVREQDKWVIMELELIEPSLYFNLDDASPARFVDAMLLHHASSVQ